MVYLSHEKKSDYTSYITFNDDVAAENIELLLLCYQTLQEKRHQTTRRILKAATTIFSEVGFAGARVDEIAKCAGVNKATIYYHIGDKQALYARVIRNLFGDAADRFEHMMIIGTIVFSKMSSPIRAKFASIANVLQPINSDLKGNAESSSMLLIFS